jgi:hypothetical protein
MLRGRHNSAARRVKSCQIYEACCTEYVRSTYACRTAMGDRDHTGMIQELLNNGRCLGPAYARHPHEERWALYRITETRIQG